MKKRFGLSSAQVIFKNINKAFVYYNYQML